MADGVDIVILSNGPGEIATWVKPVVRSLQQHAATGLPLRISVILSPCPHASGNEHLTALSYPEVGRVQAAGQFFRFLLTGRTADDWDWYDRGVVVFLGGDQLYPVLVGKRLGYPAVVYAEWEGRWQGWVRSFGAMQPQVVEKANPKYRDKFTVVGDLMADVAVAQDNRADIEARLGIGPETPLVGLLPGSKALKLKLGVPLMSAIAAHVHTHRPETCVVIPDAPTLEPQALVNYADPKQNPFVKSFGGPCLTFVAASPQHLPYLQMENGPRLYLWQTFPAFDLLSRCHICLTTVGANTAQLGALAIPMLVLLPAQKIVKEFDYLDGLPSLLSKLPGIGVLTRRLINSVVLKMLMRQGKRFAWPNIWAQREVVPELFENLTGETVGQRVLHYLDHPDQLQKIRQDLRQLRGPSGAANKMAGIILEAIP